MIRFQMEGNGSILGADLQNNFLNVNVFELTLKIQTWKQIIIIEYYLNIINSLICTKVPEIQKIWQRNAHPKFFFSSMVPLINVVEGSI